MQTVMDVPIGSQGPGAKDQRGDVTLAHCSHAHDDSEFSRLRARLVGMNRERGVEVGRGFEGILLRQVGTDQRAAGGGGRASPFHERLDGRVVLLEVPLEVAVARTEVQECALKRLVDLLLR